MAWTTIQPVMCMFLCIALHYCTVKYCCILFLYFNSGTMHELGKCNMWSSTMKCQSAVRVKCHDAAQWSYRFYSSSTIKTATVLLLWLPLLIQNALFNLVSYIWYWMGKFVVARCGLLCRWQKLTGQTDEVAKCPDIDNCWSRALTYCQILFLKCLITSSCDTNVACDFVCRASGQSLYQVLGLPKDCTAEDIKKAYRKVVSSVFLAFKWRKNCTWLLHSHRLCYLKTEPTLLCVLHSS